MTTTAPQTARLSADLAATAHRLTTPELIVVAIVMRANVVAAEDGGDPDAEADRGAEVLLGNANFDNAHRDYVAARALAALALAAGSKTLLAAAQVFADRPRLPDAGIACRGELSSTHERLTARELLVFGLCYDVLDSDALDDITDPWSYFHEGFLADRFDLENNYPTTAEERREMVEQLIDLAHHHFNGKYDEIEHRVGDEYGTITEPVLVLPCGGADLLELRHYYRAEYDTMLERAQSNLDELSSLIEERRTALDEDDE